MPLVSRETIYPQPNDLNARDMNNMRIGRAELVTSGRLLKVTQIPEVQEDYVDIDDPEAVIFALRGLRPRPDIFCFWQRLPETQPKYPYYMEWDNVAAIPVRTFDQWLNKSIHSSVRKKLRKSKKIGVVVNVANFDDKLIQGIAEIFNETPIRQGQPYPHYGKTCAEIRSEWSIDLDMSAFIGAYFEDELIGFVKLTFTERYAELYGTISMLKHRDKSPMSAMIAKAVEFCEAKRIPYLTYGKFTYGRKGEDSLSDFKRYNGFEKVQLPRYYVPLTFKGRIGLKLGLFHELSYHLPPSLMERLRNLRTAYYVNRLGKDGLEK